MRKHIFDVDASAKARDLEARKRDEKFADMIMDLNAYAIPGLRSAWTTRLAAVALLASFFGAVLGVATVRATTSDAQAGEVRR